MARTVRRILLAMTLAVICASCRVDVQVGVVMKEDGSGTVTVTAVADAEVVQQSPTLGTDLRFDDLQAAGWVVVGPGPTASGGIEVMLTHTFATPADATALLAQIGGEGGPFKGVTLDRTVVKRTTTYTLNGTLQITGGLDAFSDEDLVAAVGATPYASRLAGAGLQPADAVGITFSASLPGSIDNTTASAADQALVWQVPFDGVPVDIATLSETEDKGNTWARPVARGARIGLIVWGVIALFFIIYVMWSRRRQRIENQPWY